MLAVVMSDKTQPGNHTRLAVRRFLDAIDRALAAAREVARARAALDRETDRTGRLRIVLREHEDSDAE
jgi:hypothetical protein